MHEQIDMNKIIAEFIALKADSFLHLGKTVLGGAKAKVKAHSKETFSKYLQRTLDGISQSKSFFIRSEPRPLYDFYVPLSISVHGKIIDRPSFEDLTNKCLYSIIIGPAGCGKSMLMKHLVLSCVEGLGKIPVFIELRRINQTDESIRQTLTAQLSISGKGIDDKLLDEAIASGQFAIFLDGFDEIKQEKRASISKEIQDLQINGHLNNFIISSRPDNEFKGWTAFSEVDVQSLDISLAIDLVNKLPYDEEIKNQFVTELKKELFDNHKSFLSNPLLLSIMLLTYGQSADIPTKLSVFYNQAYEALFHKHDAYKGGYKRERKTSLDVKDYAAVFSAYCVQSYDEREFEFTESSALSYLDNAKSLVSVKYNSVDYLYDSIQAVCLLIEDGLYIVFPHRSFQEYFTAKFIIRSTSEIQRILLNKYSGMIDRDNLFMLLYEMSPAIVENNFIIPLLERFKNMLGFTKTVGITHFTRWMKYEFRNIRLSEDHLSYEMKSVGEGYVEAISFIIRNCGHYIDWKWSKYKGNWAKELYQKYSAIHGGEPIFDMDQLTSRSPIIADRGGPQNSDSMLRWLPPS